MATREKGIPESTSEPRRVPLLRVRYMALKRAILTNQDSPVHLSIGIDTIRGLSTQTSGFGLAQRA